MILFGLSLSVLIILMGILAYLITPRMKPNPFFGFRIGYTLIDKEIWVKGNKFVSILFIIDGILFSLLSMFLTDELLIIFLVIFEISVVICIVVGILYVDDLAEKVTGRRNAEKPSKIVPLKLDPKIVSYLRANAALYVALISMIVYTVKFLPDTVAVHFDFSGVPDKYDNKWFLALDIITILSLDFIIYMIFYYLAKNKPLIFYKPKLGISTSDFMKWFSVFITVTFIIVGLVYAIILAYNLYGYHILPMGFFIFLALMLIFLAIMYLVYKMRWCRHG